MMDAVAGDKVLLKDLKEVHDYLKSMDNSPEDFLSDEQLQILLGEFLHFVFFIMLISTVFSSFYAVLIARRSSLTVTLFRESSVSTNRIYYLSQDLLSQAGSVWFASGMSILVG